jgi:hypothetical protein
MSFLIADVVPSESSRTAPGVWNCGAPPLNRGGMVLPQHLAVKVSG